MGRISRSWHLFRLSVKSLFQHPKLLWFPVVAMLALTVMLSGFLTPVLLQPTGHAYGEEAHWRTVAERTGLISMSESMEKRLHPERAATPEAPAVPDAEAGGETAETPTQAPAMDLTLSASWPLLAFLAAVYLGGMFVTVFVHTAMYNEIIHALNGQPASVFGGLRFALGRWRAILLWSLFAGLVGMLIQQLEQRLSAFGSWIVRLVGIGWNVACVFAIPVLVREGDRANPLAHLRRSAEILKKTWGETLIGWTGFGGISAVFTLVFTGAIVAAIIGVTQAGTSMAFALHVTLILIWVFVLSGFILLTQIAEHVYCGALYIYATEGAAPGAFDEEAMNAAWKVKK